MGTENALSVKLNNVRDLLTKSKNQIQMALPKHLDADRMLRVVMTSVQKTPELLECDIKSLLGAVIQSSQLGLEPDGVLGQAYLIPYKNEKKGIKEAQFQVGYKGLLALARRSGDIVSLTAQPVYENDKFEYEYGLSEKLVHIPIDGERGKLKFAYAVARFKDGGHAFEVMTRKDIEKIKGSSRAAKSKFSPWQTWEEEMWRKTVTKKLCKYLPQSIELQRAATTDEYIDMGIADIPLGVEAATDDNKENLKQKIANKKKEKTKDSPQPSDHNPVISKTTTDDKQISSQSTIKSETKEPPAETKDFKTAFNELVAANGIPAENVKKELEDLGYETADDVKGETDQGIVLQYFKDTFDISG